MGKRDNTEMCCVVFSCVVVSPSLARSWRWLSGESESHRARTAERRRDDLREPAAVSHRRLLREVAKRSKYSMFFLLFWLLFLCHDDVLHRRLAVGQHA